MSANGMAPGIVDGYLSELLRDELSLCEVGDAFELAKARLDMGLRRYAALRDFVAEQLGRSPYSRDVNWPETSWDTPARGRFRFVGSKVGDALLTLLKESADTWMTLDEIVLALAEGGFGYPEPLSARTVNAALIRPPDGIVRGTLLATGKSAYQFKSASEREPFGFGDIDPDDLPFE